jgi:hypothetical protein
MKIFDTSRQYLQIKKICLCLALLASIAQASWTEVKAYKRSQSEKGAFLSWKRMPIEYAIDAVGLGDYFQKNPDKGIAGSEFQAIGAAFQTWAGVYCPKESQGPVGMNIQYKGRVNNQKIGVDHSCRTCNTNLIVFIRDQNLWRYNQLNLAITTTSYVQETGEIYDADIEINAAGFILSTQTEKTEHINWDIQGILTHEIGHVLGLDHSEFPEAVMAAKASEGELRLRTLHRDDIEGVCAIYPPTTHNSEIPRYREVASDRGIGCSSIPEPAHLQIVPLLSLLLLSLWMLRKR